MRKIQRLAARTVNAVLKGESLTTALTQLWAREAGLSVSERGAVQDLSYGALRHLSEMRHYVEQMVSRPISDPAFNALLWVALYQLRYSDNPHAVVHEAVAAAKEYKPWLKDITNAVLRRFLREREALRESAAGTLVTRYSYPQWWIDRLQTDHPAQAERLLALGNDHPPMTLRVNARQFERDSYLERLSQHGITASVTGEVALTLDHPVPVEALPGFSQGAVSVQDLGAQWAAPLLDAQPGHRVLDACAAPGGKSAHMLERSAIELTALDIHPGRLDKVRATLARLRLRAQLRCADAAQLDTWWDGRPYDRILLDAPCSASGVVRRHPDSKWLRREGDMVRFVRTQRDLLRALWQALVPGGKLLYVTCSLFHAENDAVVEDFLRTTASAERLTIYGPPDTDGQLFPTVQNDGFFYAMLRKQ